MKYRNKKRLVSIWLLEKLSAANKAHYVGQATLSTSVDKPQYIRPKDSYKVSELVRLDKYKPSIIYEASFFLLSRGYIQSVGMMNDDIANTSIKITEEGISALRDEVLEDEISNYNNDRYYSYLRWWLPVLALIVSIITIFFSTCKRTSQSNMQVLPSQQPQQETETKSLPLQGIWKLLTGTIIEKGDTTITDYTKDRSFIKIINETHFSFLHHTLRKDTTDFSAGGGRYELNGDKYTEHLEYCSAKEWEGHDFNFTVTIKGDTLVQQGIEKIEEEGIDRMNIEKYVRVKK